VTGRTERVSVSSRGREQNAAVTQSYDQVSDISSGGRYVVFDSDATNLVGGDRNRDTDVFVRDRVRRRTARVSRTSIGGEADNDSFFPSISSDGRYVAFNSFAGNLAFPGVIPGPDVYLRDLRRGTTVVANVSAGGFGRGEELQEQLLQRPAVSDDGLRVAFESGADNLVQGDINHVNDVFVRLLTPPATTVTRAPPRTTTSPFVTATVGADDPQASRFLCRLDGRPFLCRAGRVRLGPLARGPHTLRVWAGGPGLLFDPVGRVVRFARR
jgi:hypothetical protein